MDCGMIICPYCDCENITGADDCEQCGQALSDLNLPTPASYVERCVLRDRLSALHPSRPVAVVAPETKIHDVLTLLAQRSIGCVLVTQEDRILGIFSERDVLIKLNTQAAKFMNRPVSEFMTRDPQSLDSEAKVAFAIHRMSVGGFRHVPVTDAHGVPVSMVSVRDVLRYLTEKMRENVSTDSAPS
jgi:CBS domain-containing protein